MMQFSFQFPNGKNDFSHKLTAEGIVGH